MSEYWLIVYQWRRPMERNVAIISNDVHEGPLWKWVEMSREQPEDWVLLNAVPITMGDYNKLKGTF